MRNYLKLALLGGILIVGTFEGKSATLTTVVAQGGFTNLLQGFQNSALVSGITITSPTATNSSALIIDTYTNSLTYTNAAYTQRGFYLTNYVYNYTNFYGVVQNYTNGPTQVDITNTVAASTNSFPVRYGVAASAASSANYNNIDAYFAHGVWATNTGGGSATITITYK